MSFPLIACTPHGAVVANDRRGVDAFGRPVRDTIRKIDAIPGALVLWSGALRWRAAVLAALVGRPSAEWGFVVRDVAPRVRQDTALAVVPAAERHTAYVLALEGGGFIPYILNFWNGTIELGGRISAGVPFGADEDSVTRAVRQYDADLSSLADARAMITRTLRLFRDVRAPLGERGSLSQVVDVLVLQHVGPGELQLTATDDSLTGLLAEVVPC